MVSRGAWVLAYLTLVFVVADVVITAQYRTMLSEEVVAQHGFPLVTGAVLGSAVLGAFIVTRHERHPVGVLLCLIGAGSAFSLMTEAYSLWVIREDGPGPTSLGHVAGWGSTLVGGQLAIGALALMFLLAPDGRLVSRRWRYAAVSTLLGMLLCVLAVLTRNPTSFDPQATEGPMVTVLLSSVGFLLVCLGLVFSAVSLAVRLRRSEGVERQQVRLIAAAAALLAAGVLALIVVQISNGGQQTWASHIPLYLAFMLLPVLFAVATLRYRLYDIEVIINRTVLIAVGTAFAALGYTTLVVVVGQFVDSRTGGFWVSLLTTAVVALAFQPLRRSVVRLADRFAYGPRARPYEALSDFSHRLSQTPSPEALLATVAEAAGRAVAASRATATLYAAAPGTSRLSGTWGEGRTEGATTTCSVPVRHAAAELGSIEVSIPKGRPWRGSDQRLLSALADQTAVAFRNTAIEAELAAQVDELSRTNRQLAESRSRIVEADDTARRTLEAAISREVLPRLLVMPEALRRGRARVAAGDADTGLDQLVEDTNSALESLRELTRGVFPTQLTRAGVEPALRSLLARAAPGAILSVDAAASGRRFSPRVETTVYFCCARTARSSPSSVELSIQGTELVVHVRGVTGSEVDVQSVVDRVEAVGGSLIAEPASVTLRIPLGPDELAAGSSVASSVHAVSGGGRPRL